MTATPDATPTYYIGLMSGTSMDGVDGVLASFDSVHTGALTAPMRVCSHAFRPLPAPLREQLLSLNQPGPDELHRAALAANTLTQLYASVCQDLLEAAELAPSQVAAIGAHGQTVRHQPGRHDGIGYTLQIQQPALLAELTGMDVIADFRQRDVAAGGQGAPLVPAFHRAIFGRADQTVAVLNLGGMANVSVLFPDGRTMGFDCGPGNVLLDSWHLTHRGGHYDPGGQWAASGQVQGDLLTLCLQDPFFLSPPPKSTGRDHFNPVWLDERLHLLGHRLSPEDVQATLLALTSASATDALRQCTPPTATLLVCGGGALNDHLMKDLQHRWPHGSVQSTAKAGLPPMQVEAAAFAWLAYAHCNHQAGNLPAVTGARGPRILGARYPA